MTAHGTVSGYTAGGCRCKHCQRAWREYFREYRARPGVRRAHSDYERERRAKKKASA